MSWTLDNNNWADFGYNDPGDGINVMCVTGKAEQINAANTVETTYDYRGDNYLVGVDLYRASPALDVQVDYDYDILGRQVYRALSGSGVATYPQHAGSTILGEVSTGQGAPDPAYYAYGLGRVSRSQDGTAYYHADAQGSTRVLTEDDGSDIEWYTYDAWGNEAEDPDAANDYRYCGQWDYSTDGNTVWQPQGIYRTGLMHLGCRYYDAELGRFIQPDPRLGSLYSPQSLNRYTYCLNSPLEWIDPGGAEFRKPPANGVVRNYTPFPIRIIGDDTRSSGNKTLQPGHRTGLVSADADEILSPFLPVVDLSDGSIHSGEDYKVGPQDVTLFWIPSCPCVIFMNPVENKSSARWPLSWIQNKAIGKGMDGVGWH